MELIKSKDIIHIVRRTLNLVDSRLVEHGERVGYIVYKMLTAFDRFDKKQIMDICILSIFHDIGAYKTDEIDNMLHFETVNVWRHSIYGYLFIKQMTPLSELASVILFHHIDYSKLKLLNEEHSEIATILNLADRLDIYLQTKKGMISEEKLKPMRDTKFSSLSIDLLLKANQNNEIVENILSGEYMNELNEQIDQLHFTIEEIEQYLHMLIYSIDFRSEATVVHTINTVSISIELARVCGLSEAEIEKIKFGALLHDLGKIGIPLEILENPGKLIDSEMNVMKSHVSITEEIICEVINDEICQIAIRHHEKLDGTGYPKRLMAHELSKAQRIVAVADIMSALSGTRSYKNSYPKERIVAILTSMKNNGKLCPDTVDSMLQNYDAIMKNTEENCSMVLEMYAGIKLDYNRIYEQCKDL